MKIYCDSSTTEACLVKVLPSAQEQVFKEAYTKRVTNNVGEYRAVLWALLKVKNWKKVKNWEGEDAEILTDSQLVVEQVAGNWMCRKSHLLPLRDEVRRLLEETGATLAWVPRATNLAGLVLEGKG